jgi:hypothetical protein
MRLNGGPDNVQRIGDVEDINNVEIRSPPSGKLIIKVVANLIPGIGNEVVRVLLTLNTGVYDSL